MSDFREWRRNCDEAVGGRKEPYEDEPCDHQFEYNDDAQEYICAGCGERLPPDLTELIK